MLFDTSAFLRVGIAGLVDATSASASFATTTGDMLEVSAYTDGAFRLRVGPTSRPDYGLVSGRTRSFTTLPAGANRWTLTNGDTALSIGGSPCTLTLSWRDGHVLASTTDRLPGGDTRLPSLGRAPRGALARLRADDDVAWVERDVRVRAQARPVPGSPVRRERSSHVTIMRTGTSTGEIQVASGTSMNTRPVEQIGRVASSAPSSASAFSSAVMRCCTRA